MIIYPLSALRAVALRTQGLQIPNGKEPTPGRSALYDLVNQIGCVQIDTIHVIQRSQYLVPWSRMENYDPADLDALVFSPERRLFEGWQHAACILPLTEYRYQMPHQRYLRENPAKMSGVWLSKPGTHELVQSVRERIRREGALRANTFEYHGPKRTGWWDWKPAKNALEHLYAWGDLMIADRVNFQRVYDLTERVLPDWVDTTEPSSQERDRFWVERGARALGVCTPKQAGDYTWMKASRSLPHVEKLIADGILVTIQGQLANGRTASLVVHRDNLPLLEGAADGALTCGRTTFLSPFDSLFWATRRDEQLWGFHQALEAYKPVGKRTWGYYCLAILHGDRLVGRFDPKLERQNGTLRLKALYLEAEVKPDEGLLAGMAVAMRDFMAFHQAKDLVIERSQPEKLGNKLMAVM